MISTVDILIIIIYLIAMLGIGYFVGKNNRTQEDFFLAGRSMPWIPIALSVSATMISANSFIGGPGWAYNEGIAPFMVNITVPLAVFFALSVTTPVIYRVRVTSVYEYMEYRLGHISRNLTVAQFFINSLIQVSSMVFIPSLILQKLTGMPLKVVVPIVVIISISYTIMGGIKAVIWTDVVQMIVLWGSLFAVIFLGLKHINMGFFETIGMAREAGKLKALDFQFDISKTNTFWASLIGGTIMWIRYFCFDQVQVQRVLTAKSLKGIKSSFLTSAFLMNIMYFIMLTVGLILWVYFGGRKFQTSNEIMITYMLEKLPIGVLGLAISGALAAAMSSVDSLLNSLTTVFIKDIYEKYFKKDKGETTLKLTMSIAAVFGVIIILFVIVGFGGTVKSVLDVVGKYISYFSGPACGSFLLAMFTLKANDKGVAVGFILGTIGCFLIANVYKVSWLWNPAIGCALTCILGYIASMLFKNSCKPINDIKEYTVNGMREKMIKEGTIEEDGISILPFKIDKYAIITLVFFFLQYIFLALLQF
ncbi:transporter, SSS family [Caloramator quimbayensis]|uniref:Transporter, SSS family n=1 Tax=Caloramator quimbayensis TaxID=1147123 RepID=A0A1T4XTJ7_9CLOT|nr:sodium/solute symporter [Caloramator quimbayensis]SKA92850.1 transporter, SSS family [Caloramator quimbayensis]